MVGVGLRVYDVEPLKILRLKTFDYYQKIQPRTVTSNHFVVVEITEQDLKQYGQWPWNRNFMADIHQRIINQKANTVQYNILFSEADRLNASSFVETQPLTDDLARSFGVGKDAGVLISGVYRRGPAANADILPGDILTHMNGQKITDGRLAMNQVADFEPGTQIPIKLLRKGQTIDRMITVGQRPNSASN